MVKKSDDIFDQTPTSPHDHEFDENGGFDDDYFNNTENVKTDS
jgi:hypothetical protein